MKCYYNIGGQLEIQKDGICFMNSKKAILLKHILKTGSINGASKAMKMSYQQAWHFIKELNELSPLPIVIRQRGGTNGGGAKITDFGVKLINMYDALQTKFETFKQDISYDLNSCFFEKITEKPN